MIIKNLRGKLIGKENLPETRHYFDDSKHTLFPHYMPKFMLPKALTQVYWSKQNYGWSDFSPEELYTGQNVKDREVKSTVKRNYVDIKVKQQ